MKVAAIFVNYRTSELTVRAAQALLAELEQDPRTAGEASHVFVVDNDSQDGSYQTIFTATRTLGLDRRVTVLAAPRNGGYGYGINLAVRRALALDRPEYVFILNTDAFVDRGSLGKLIAFMDSHPGAGMAGSLVHGPDGVTQGAAFRFPSPLGELEQTARFGVVSRLLRRHAVPMPPPNEDREVDWLPGTSMLIRAAVFERGIFFDEDFFLYFEEVDFARRLRQAGWRSYFVAGAPVTHIGSVSTGLAEQGRRVPDYWFDSRHRYLRKHHGAAYTAAADLAWMVGHLVYLSKRAALGRTDVLRRNLMRDFLRAGARQLARGQLAVSRSPEPPADHRPATALSLAALVAEDLATVEHDPLDPGFWAVLAHRLASKSRQARSLPARGVLSGLARALGAGVDGLWRINLPASVELGRRVRLHHGGGGMMLNARAIGDDVQIRHDTTFGPLHAGGAALPVIEDGADLGAGVSVLGGITVGRGAVAVAGSLLLKDVTAGTTVVGVPAKSAPARSAPANDGGGDAIPSPPARTGSGLSTAVLVQRLIEDVRTYRSDFTEVGLWVTAAHRVRRWAERTLPGPLRSPVRAGAGAFMTSIDWLFGVRVPAEATLGRRVRIWHHGCIRLAATIGDDVHIRPNTTLGPADGPAGDPARSPARWPVIGDKVDIGAGASILGPVRVGSESFVGANSLVLADVPDRGAALGVPARLLPRRPPRREATPSTGPAPPTATPPVPAPEPHGARDGNPSDIGLLALLAEDLRTYGGRVSAPGFWATVVHRFGNWRMGVRKPFRAPLTVLYRTAFQGVRLGLGIDLPYDTALGRRVRIEHHGSVIIGARSIGNDVVIRGGAILGVMNRDASEDDKPTIDDGVEIGPRACVVGAVTVGRDAHICGNTVVPMNVPAGATVLGVPGRLVDLREHAGSTGRSGVADRGSDGDRLLADQARDAAYVSEVRVEQDLVG